jgi:hypothetical protein
MSVGEGVRPTTARWGWHGASIISRPETATPNNCARLPRIAPDLRTIAAGLARTDDDTPRIESELASLRPVYHRYLRQDEFGPGRVEQLIALRDVAKFVDRAIDLLNTVPSLQNHLSIELDSIERFASITWFGATEMRALALAADRLRRKSDQHQLSRSQIDLLRNLASTLTELINRISLLDSNSQATVRLAARCGRRLEPAAVASTTVEQNLSKLKLQLQLAISAFERIRGPAPQRSLPWLVAYLCDLWRRETGLGIESLRWTGDGGGQPCSQGAKFVISVVEAFQPEQDWFQGQLPAYTSTQLIFVRPALHRARRVKYLIRDYVRRQPQDHIPRRRPRLTGGSSRATPTL